MEVVTMPKLGLIMTEGTIAEWYKKEGDHVKQGEALLQIETQKITHDVEAPVSGNLVKVLAQVGDVIPCHDPVAQIQTEGSAKD